MEVMLGFRASEKECGKSKIFVSRRLKANLTKIV